jgi:hypothetical protein
MADERLSLNPAVCWLDTQAFEIRLKQAERLRSESGDSQGIALIQEALALYAGAFRPSNISRPRVRGQKVRRAAARR